MSTQTRSAAPPPERSDRAPLHVVVNGRASGVGDPQATAVRAVAALAAAGAPAAATVTQDLAELAALVERAQGDRLVLVGGDGAVHAVANLPASLPELALLPAGRANNIAHGLGIPVELAAAARLAVTGRARAVDALGVSTSERTLVAVEGVSAGFHAAARHRYHADNSGALAQGVGALVAELAAFEPYSAGLTADGAPIVAHDLAQLFLANLPRFGFGFEVDPHAQVGDGRLEAIVLRGRTRRDVVRLLAAARRGVHLDRPGATWQRAREVRLETPLPLVADAEPLGVTTARIGVLAGHLRIVAPEAPR